MFNTTFLAGLFTGIVLCAAFLMIPVGCSSPGEVSAGSQVLSLQHRDGELHWFLHESGLNRMPVVPVGLRGPLANRRFLLNRVPVEFIVEGKLDKNTVAVNRIDGTTLPVFVCKSRPIGQYAVPLRLFHLLAYRPNDFPGSRYLFISKVRSSE